MTRGQRLAKVKAALLCMQRHSWEQGVAAQAFMEAGDTETAILLARDAVVRQRGDGRLGVMGSDTASTDPAANGEPVLYASNITGDAFFGDAASRIAAWLLNDAPRSEEGTLYHHIDSKEIWVDSFYMAPPFLAAAGHAREAVAQIEGFRKILWNTHTRLFSHMWDDGGKNFRREAFWGVGNGWAAAGMTRVLFSLPTKMESEKRRLAGYIRECVDGILACQRGDKLFHDVLDDPASFVETNTAQILAYTIYRCVVGGILEKKYRALADDMRKAVYLKTDEDGLVRGVCGAPGFDCPGTAPEGQAFFILMEAASRLS